MMKLISLSVLALVTVLVGAGCFEKEAERPDGQHNEPMSQMDRMSGSYAARVSASTLKHLRQVAKENPTGNYMISPYSVQECLGMVRLGAVGKTNRELAEWLGTDLDAAKAASSAADYRNGLASLSQAGIFSTANGLWVRQGDAFKADFLAAVRKDCQGEARSFTAANQALQEVNSFVKEGTREMIPKLLDRLDASAVSVLVNAVSFKDKWEVPFEKNLTTEKDFQTPDGLKKVPMMRGRQGFYAMEAEGFVLGSGAFTGGLKITFALPPTAKEAPESCFPHLLKAAKDGIREPAQAFEIPRLKSDFKWDLRKTMEAMGVKTPFGGGADFSRMLDGVFISEAIQKSFVEFDEEGVKAAAATAVVMTRSAAPRPGVAFIANRPFAYVIHDSMGMPLFIGVVRDPSLFGG